MADIDRLRALHRFVTHNRDEARQMRLDMAAYLLDIARLELEKGLSEAKRSPLTPPVGRPEPAGSTGPSHPES